MNTRPPSLWWVARIAIVATATMAMASARAADVEVGQPAPEFALPDQSGKVHHLADYRGRTVVLMFYPKDFTPG